MGWEWGCWDDEITSDEMDNSRKFPAFSTSKHINTYLVGGIPTPLKNDGVRQWEGLFPYMKWTNNPFMFQTTNQIS